MGFGFSWLAGKVMNKFGHDISGNLLSRWRLLKTCLLSPSIGITKEIISRGPQVLDMEYRESDRLEHGPGGPILFFISTSTLSTVAASITSTWSCSRNGSCSMR
jgi:hypothetical protein